MHYRIQWRRRVNWAWTETDNIRYIGYGLAKTSLEHNCTQGFWKRPARNCCQYRIIQVEEVIQERTR